VEPHPLEPPEQHPPRRLSPVRATGSHRHDHRLPIEGAPTTGPTPMQRRCPAAPRSHPAPARHQ